MSDTIIKKILPAMRAIVARKLIETYGLSQKQTAQKLGATQPAISQYKRGIRGMKVDIITNYPKLSEMLETVAKKVASGEIADEQVTIEFFKICEYLAAEGLFSKKSE